MTDETSPTDVPDDAFVSEELDGDHLSPICKYLGGKRDLAPFIASLIPDPIDAYIEPFMGGGAVFFELYRTGRLAKARSVDLNDLNESLIDLYETIREDPKGLSERVEKIIGEYRKAPEKVYKYVRDLWNQRDRSAAKCLFLRYTSYNGLWRENKSGGMNADFGKYPNLFIPSLERLEAVSRAFKYVNFTATRFDDVLAFLGEMARPGVALYCDSPYLQSFKEYTRHGWTQTEHVELIKICKHWADQGATVIKSHSDIPIMRELLAQHWPNAYIVETSRRDFVNRDGQGREPKSELIITNSPLAKQYLA